MGVVMEQLNLWDGDWVDKNAFVASQLDWNALQQNYRYAKFRFRFWSG